MSKKLYTINEDTFEIEEHDYKTIMQHYSSIFGKNCIEERTEEYIQFYCAEEVQYYFSRKVALKISNKLLSKKLEVENECMQCALDDYYSHRKFIEEFTGKIIK